MPKTRRTPREQLERAMHVSFKLPEQARVMLDAYRDQVREEVAAEIDAAAEHTLATYPTNEYPAMSARVLGLRSAARVARTGQGG